jgi:predicted ATPase with chaperone activity
MSSERMREQVIRARQVQRERFSADSTGGKSDLDSAGGGSLRSSNHELRSSTTTNASMSTRRLRRYCKLDEASEALLKQAMTELGLSARAHDKVLRIARTIADIEGIENIESHHIAEAVQYRRLDRRS